MPYSDRGPGDQPAPEFTPVGRAGPQLPPGFTPTPFGPMIGQFSRNMSDPYLQALYDGSITPDEYRRLTGT